MLGDALVRRIPAVVERVKKLAIEGTKEGLLQEERRLYAHIFSPHFDLEGGAGFLLVPAVEACHVLIDGGDLVHDPVGVLQFTPGVLELLLVAGAPLLGCLDPGFEGVQLQ